MCQELYELLEKQLLRLDGPPPISLEEAEVLMGNEGWAGLHTLEAVEEKLTKDEGDF